MFQLSCQSIMRVLSCFECSVRCLSFQLIGVELIIRLGVLGKKTPPPPTVAM